MLIFSNKRGSLTIFISLILTVVIIFTTVLIDAGKIVLARNLVSGAGDLTLSAGLSSYNTTLLDAYGIFANSKDMDELEKNLRKYFEETLAHEGIKDSGIVNFATSLALSGNKPANLFDISVDEFDIEGTEGANLSNVKVLKAEILEYSKYRAPVSMGYGFLEKLNIFKSLKDQQAVLSNKKEYEKKLKSVEELSKAIYVVEKYLQDYALGSGNTHIWSNSPKSILKQSEEGGFSPAHRGYASLEQIKEGTVKTQDEFIDDANRHALSIAYVKSVEKIPSGETWNNPLKLDEVSGYTDIENIKADLDSRSGRLGRLYADIENIKTGISSTDYSTLKVYEYLDATANYFEEYKKLVNVFRDVGYLYDKKIKEIDERIEELEEEIANAQDSEYVDPTTGSVTTVSADTSSEENEIRELNEKKSELSTWYKNDYRRIAKYCDMESLREDFVSRCKSKISLFDLQQARDIVEKEQNWFSVYHQNATLLKGLLEKLKEDSEALKTIKAKWSESIGKLGESGIKSNMQNDYDTKTDLVVDKFIEENIKVASNIETYARVGKEDMESIKHLKNPVYSISPDNSENIVSYMENYVNSSAGKPTVTKAAMLTDLKDNIYTKINSSTSAYGGTAYKVGEVSIPYNTNGELYVFGLDKLESELRKTYAEPQVLNNLIFERQNMSGAENEKDDLYKILKSLYSKSENIDKDAKKNTENARDEKLKNETKLQSEEARDVSKVTIEHVMSENPKVGEVLKTEFGTDSENIADNVLEQTGNAVSGFEKLAEIAVKGRDALYMTEYITEMFSAYTTNIKDGKEVAEADRELTMTGIAFSKENNFSYRAEQEYILLGGDADSNIDGVRNRIFAIRTLLNLIFAYTGNSKLNTETFTMATTIAGWTGFGVPIVQNVLMVIAAVVESVYDTKDLMDGHSIAVYKSMPTWKFYYTSAAVKVAKDLASEAIYNTVNKVTDDLKENAEKTIDELSEKLDEYVGKTVENSVENIVLYFQVPIQQMLLKAISSMEADTTKSLEESRKIIKQGFEDLKVELNEQKAKLAGVGGESPLLIEAKLKVLEYLNTDEVIDDLAGMVDEIIKAEEGEVANASKELEKGVRKFFDKRNKEFERRVKIVIDDKKLKEELIEEAKSIIDAGGELAQSKLNDMLNKFATKFDGSIPKNAGLLSEFDATRASLFSMSYKEYLKIFILIASLVNEVPIIERVGNLIQANTTKEGSEYYISKDFKLKNAHTMLNLKTKVGIKPTFINLDYSSFGINNEYFKDAAKYKMEYKGVMGY